MKLVMLAFEAELTSNANMQLRHHLAYQLAKTEGASDQNHCMHSAIFG